MTTTTGGVGRRPIFTPSIMTSTTIATSIPTLLDLTSLTVSQTYPFQTIEDRYKNIIPEPVQKSIIFHSFPKQESQVLVYASSDFNPERYGVEQVVQIGFHVSGLVYEIGSSGGNKRGSGSSSRVRRGGGGGSSSNDNNNAADESLPEPSTSSSSTATAATTSSSLLLSQPPSNISSSYNKVSATFDRGKITSVSCSCCSSSSSSSSSETNSNSNNSNDKSSSPSLIFWCDHVIALSLHRIRKCRVGVDFVLRVPISETLLQLNRSQLQKLVQYLISDHTDVLPTAQRLADEILFMKTDDNFINRIHGAPDPTAGPHPQDPHSWALNESQIQSQVRQFLSTHQPQPQTQQSSVAASNNSNNASSLTISSSSSSNNSNNVIQILIEKIYKMIQSHDSNAERILQIITNELVRHSTTSKSTTSSSNHGNNHRSSSSSNPPPTISNSIWDQIIRIWNVIVLKPGMTEGEVNALESILTPLSRNEWLPESEEYYCSSGGSSGCSSCSCCCGYSTCCGANSNGKENENGCDSSSSSSSDDDDDSDNDEDVDMATAPSQQQQPKDQNNHIIIIPSPTKRQKLQAQDDPTSSSSPSQQQPTTTTHHHDSIFKTPVNLLKRRTNKPDYEILSLHSKVCHGNHDIQHALRILDELRNGSSSSPLATTSSSIITNKPPTIRLENAHLLFNVLKQSHPSEAYEAALIGLTTPTVLKPTAYAHEKHLKLVEKLIGKVVALTSSSSTSTPAAAATTATITTPSSSSSTTMATATTTTALHNSYNDILSRYVEMLISEKNTKKLCWGSHSNNPHHHGFPLISFASYVFSALGGNELAYKLALKHLNVYNSENTHSYHGNGNNSSSSSPHTTTHLESQQITLATNLLTTAKDSPTRLEEITSTLIRVVKSNTNLFRLAQEVFKHASTENLISVAFNIALHVVKATKYSVHRRRWEMVRWVVSCGLEIGVSKLFYLVRNWGEYFSAVEAVGSVASSVLAWVGGGGSGSNVGGSGSNTQQCNERGCSSNNSNNNNANSSSTSTTNPREGMINTKLTNVDIRILEELGNSARNLAIQCAKNDPQNCALNTLTLCESDPLTFETSYQIVLESASKEFLTPQQIFTIARYMEHRGYTQRAYRLAVIAVQHVHIGYNQDTHSLISEIHWTCNLSHQLSTPMSTTTTTTTIPPPPPQQRCYNHHHQQQQQPSTSHSHHHHHPHHNSKSSKQQQQPAHSSSSSSSSCYNYSSSRQTTSSSSSLLLQPPTTELENLIPLLIRNIKCATVLTEILRRSITIMSSYENAYQKGSSTATTTSSDGHHHHHHHHSNGSSSGSSHHHHHHTHHRSSSSSSSSKKLKHQQQQAHSNTHPHSNNSTSTQQQRLYSKLSLLIEGTIDSYITTTHSRLVHISPRHYSDFIEFLSKARENFLLAPNGGERFKHLVESMKCTYKGKKKLLFLLGERFG